MIELTEWAHHHPLPARPWLVVGKGPTFRRVHDADPSLYNVVALNHVVRELKVNVAHFADLEAVVDCADAVLTNADWVLMPYRPHIKFQVGESLAELAQSVPVLRELDRRGRLVWYNLSTGVPEGDSPVIHASHFGSEAVVNILATLGVKVIRTLGVDGGRAYDSTFNDLTGKTLLAGGESTYDLQFVGIRKTVERYGIDFGPLRVPMRVFVGTDASQRVAARVLEYTIRKHASRPVDVIYLDAVDVPVPRDHANRGRTGFSFKRFAIPSLCNYRGRALYVDADMLVFDDIARLWELPMDAHDVLCTSQPEPPTAWRNNPTFKTGRQMSVMLLNCARLAWDPVDIVRGLDDGRYTYAQLMFDLCVVPPERIADTLAPEWNSLERYEPGLTKLLHYTVVPTQPWRHDNPLEHVWLAQFAEAVAAGAVPVAEIEDGIAQGYLKPALAACVAMAPRSGVTTRGADGAASASFELEARAARAETLMARSEIQALRQEIQWLRNSWTWYIGRLFTGPIRRAMAAARRIAGRIQPGRRPGPVAVREEDLPGLYREMHAKRLFPGITWRGVLDLFASVVPGLERRTVLDFGCGPRGGLAEHLGADRVVSYDPYVEAYSASPWDRPFDVVFSSDVLEHLPQADIRAFAAQVRQSSPEYIFLNISTREAHKTFSNGANVHVTVKPTAWWRATLGVHWDDDYACRVLRDDAEECTLLFERREKRLPTR